MRVISNALAVLLVLLCVCMGISSRVHAEQSLNARASSTNGSRLYITFHGGSDDGSINTIQSYDFDGNLLDDDVLTGDTQSELRSMLVLPDQTLLVANSHKNDSRIAHYSACGANGKRKYMGDFTGAAHTAHPYGLAFGADLAKADNVLWVSNQDSFDVTQFGATGTFQQQLRAFGTEELRSIAYNANTGVLYVANEDEDTVLGFETSSHTWNTALKLNVTTPVGLFMDLSKNVLFVGSNNANSTAGFVYAFDVSVPANGGVPANKLTQRFTHAHMKHPTGIVVRNDEVYILAQKDGNLAQFSYSTGEHIGYVVEDFDDTVEQIIISPC